MRSASRVWHVCGTCGMGTWLMGRRALDLSCWGYDNRVNVWALWGMAGVAQIPTRSYPLQLHAQLCSPVRARSSLRRNLSKRSKAHAVLRPLPTPSLVDFGPGSCPRRSA